MPIPGDIGVAFRVRAPQVYERGRQCVVSLEARSGASLVAPTSGTFTLRSPAGVVIVTGASSGLGVAFAQGFAEAGAHVVRVHDVAATRQQLRETARTVDEPGVHANAEPTQQLFELVQRALGRVAGQAQRGAQRGLQCAAFQHHAIALLADLTDCMLEMRGAAHGGVFHCLDRFHGGAGGVFHGLLKIRLSDTPQLFGTHTRRKPPCQFLAINQPVRLWITTNDCGGKQHKKPPDELF